jgi:hypothetical protein
MNLDLLFSQASLWLLLKIGFLIAYLLYVLFAVVIMAQVKQMTKTIDAGMNGTLLTLSKFHMLLAIGLLVLALVVL